MTELRELQNNVEIVGAIKKIELEEKKSARTGKEFIAGNVTIEVVENKDRIHNIRVRVFSNKFKKNGDLNGLFKGYKTVKDEYQPGDLVRVTGDLRLEEYYGRNNNLVSFNSVSGTFFNRVEDNAENARHRALATIESVIMEIISETDAEGLPTGNLRVNAFTVGYNGRVIPLNDVIISEQLGEQFKGMYTPGSTGLITYKINNYAELSEEEVEQEQAGFGSAARVETNVVTDFVSNLEIIGGDLPYSDGVSEYSPLDIEQANKNRELAKQALMQQNQAPATPSTPTGFGSAGTTNETPVTVTEDDLPDF